MALYNFEFIISPLSASLPSSAFDGYLAYAEDDNTIYQYDGSAWVPMSAPASDPVFVGAVTHEPASGSDDQLLSDSGSAVTTYTNLTPSNECIDTDGFHSTSSDTDRMTPPSDHLEAYVVTANIYFGINNNSFVNTRARGRIDRINSGGSVVELIAIHDWDRFDNTTLRIGGSLGGVSRNVASGDYFVVRASVDTDSTSIGANLINFGLFKIGEW